MVEDEARLATALKRGLAREGFAVEVADDGETGLWLATEERFDVIVLDVMLPGLNGFDVCARLRAAQVWTPILMLTAKVGDLDHAEALDTGRRRLPDQAVLVRRAPRPPPGPRAPGRTGAPDRARSG